MNSWTGLGVYLVVGVLGGYIGSRLKLPGGVMVGAMVAVILFKVLANTKWGDVPGGYTFMVQILIGVMVGAGYNKEVAGLFSSLALPVVISTLVLVGAGLLMSVILMKFGVMDGTTAYLSTSPGAMSALISLAGESAAHPTVVMAFHFFRVVFIILTAPLIFQLLRFWLGSSTP